MRLAFRQGASLDEVRSFLAQVVRLARRSAVGEWKLTEKTPLPHDGLGPMSELARTKWALDGATLDQKVEGGSGNPRDGYGFDMAITVSATGDDGRPRGVSLSDGSYDPAPKELVFSLSGFTAAEFLAAREAGKQRFSRDDTANPIWARDNVAELKAQGAFEAARALAVEGLAQQAPAFARLSRLELRQQLIALTADPGERAALEAVSLTEDLNDVARLDAVASGALVLPGWTPDRATRLLASVRPWRPTSLPLFGGAAARWLDHPWWQPARAATLTGWFAANNQAHEVKWDGANREIRVVIPRGPKLPVTLAMAMDAVKRALGLFDVTLYLQGGVDERADGSVIAGDRFRGIAWRKGPEAGVEWAWLWTGDGFDGAVLAARNDETHLAFLGAAAPVVERIVLTPL